MRDGCNDEKIIWLGKIMKEQLQYIIDNIEKLSPKYYQIVELWVSTAYDRCKAILEGRLR